MQHDFKVSRKTLGTDKEQIMQMLGKKETQEKEEKEKKVRNVVLGNGMGNNNCLGSQRKVRKTIKKNEMPISSDKNKNNSGC